MYDCFAMEMAKRAFSRKKSNLLKCFIRWLQAPIQSVEVFPFFLQVKVYEILI